VIVNIAILRVAALLVPRPERAEWLAEWVSELWYVREMRPGEATAFCLGSFPDAFWLRRNNAPIDARKIFHLESPLRCIALLALLAGASFIFSGHMIKEIRILPHLLIILMALLVLPVVTSLDFGEYPANNRPLSWPGRRWMFFATKVALLLTTVFCGAITLVATGAPILAGYVFVFRWALMDQRRRCPVCLHVLTSPVRIGEPSHTFLAWYGTELICAKGHGVLHVPEIATSCYRTQRWLDLDLCLK
jgi:hypothetical protein